MNALYLLFMLYMLSPKIDLIAFGGSAIRPEDAIFAVAAFLYVLKSHRTPVVLPRHLKVYLTFIAINFLSAIINVPREGITGFVFALRLVEYLGWFFILYEACQRLSPDLMRKSLLLIASFFIVWGGLEATGLIANVGKFGGAAQRLSLNTSGPFESSVMIAILADAAQQVIVTPALLVLLLLTQARITLIGAVASFVIVRPRRGLAIGGLVIVVGLLFSGPLLTLYGGSRFANSSTASSMGDLLTKNWQSTPTIADPSYFREQFLGGRTLYDYLPDTRGDLSFKIRAVRWPIVIKSTLAQPNSLVVGWGPGAWGSALDSYYVRIFGEVGLLGLLVFAAWVVVAVREARAKSVLLFSLLTMSIAGVFIDIFVSSKVMPLVWMFAALEAARHPSGLSSPMWRTPIRLLSPWAARRSAREVAV